MNGVGKMSKTFEEIYARTNEQMKKIEILKKKRQAQLEYLERAYKHLDNIFDLGMAMILIVNIIFFMWNNYSVYTAMSIGLVSGLWLANYMYRGLRTI